VNREMFEHLAYKARRDEPYNDGRFPPSVYYRFMRQLAAYIHPRLSVELGVCGGGGGLHLALGYPEGYVVGIDKCDNYPENIRHILGACCNYEFRIGDSWKEAVKVYADFGKIDILFIDTVHTYDRTMLEFIVWRPYLSRHAVVLLDDLYREGMDELWEDMPGSKVRLDDLHYGDSTTGGGFGVVYDIPD